MRFKVALFLVCGFLVVALLYTISQAIGTLARLDVVERERDQWQRPAEIIEALNLREGAIVVDLGSGAGYFSLKLSPVVGAKGKVLAVDLRKISLTFLWIRALLWDRRNVKVMLGEANDPHLPSSVDAVLVVNTYHELTNAKSILDRVRTALVSGGRLVIADRGPEASGEHKLARSSVEEEVRREGFEIVARQDRFLDQPGEGPWWLIVARKP